MGVQGIIAAVPTMPILAKGFDPNWLVEFFSHPAHLSRRRPAECPPTWRLGSTQEIACECACAVEFLCRRDFEQEVVLHGHVGSDPHGLPQNRCEPAGSVGLCNALPCGWHRLERSMNECLKQKELRCQG